MLDKDLFDEIIEIKRAFYMIPIYVMPKASNIKELEQNAPRVIDIALKHKFIYSDRLLLDCGMIKRGF